MSDPVKAPSHYTQFKMQPIEFIKANLGVLDPFQANIIKYVCRFKLKNGIEDLNKAQAYLDMLKEEWKKEHQPFTRLCTCGCGLTMAEYNPRKPL